MPTPLTIKEVQHLRKTSEPLSWRLRLNWSVQLFSTRFIIIGFVAIFWHFAAVLLPYSKSFWLFSSTIPYDKE
jgi:hypothetical protein